MLSLEGRNNASISLCCSFSRVNCELALKKRVAKRLFSRVADQFFKMSAVFLVVGHVIYFSIFLLLSCKKSWVFCSLMFCAINSVFTVLHLAWCNPEYQCKLGHE